EPGRSPGLLVSSYLAVSPLPRSRCREAPGRGGLFSVALSLSGPQPRTQTVGVTHHRALRSPDFPPWHAPQHEPPRRSVSLPASPPRHTARRRTSRPPRTLNSSYGSDIGEATREEGRSARRDDLGLRDQPGIGRQRR